MDDKKEEVTETLVKVFGDGEFEETESINEMKYFAYRRLGKSAGRRIIDSLDRLDRKRKAEKAEVK